MNGFYDGKTYSCFRKLDDFFNHVLTPEFSQWRIFAHFGGRYDIHFLFDHIKNRMPGTRFDFYCAGSAVISFTIEQGRNWWRFCDSFRLLPASLDKLTTEFDVEHKKLSFAPTDWKYNRNDCMGLYEVLEKFFGMYGVNSETAPAHSMKIFRAHYQRRSIMIPHRDVEEDCRRCYFGGRTEVYRYDEGHVFKYDVNSLFPRAMLEPVPVEYIARSRDLPDDDRRIGFYHATVTIPEDVYLPALPYKIEKLYFPVGKLKGGFFTSMELRQAIMDGCAVTIHGGVLFLAEPILKEYIEDVHRLKQKAEREGNAGLRYAYKIQMNSFYGKWGQGRVRRAYCFDDGSTELYPLEHSPGLAWYWVESHSPFIMPQIAATITARARLIQLEYLKQPLTKRGGRIWYTDTDSLFTNRRVVAGTQMGDMAFEGKGMFQPYGLKEYRWENKLSIKGVPLKKVDQSTGEKSYDGSLGERYLKGEEIEIKRLAGFMESIRRGLPTVRRVTVKRQLKNPRQKRARVGDATRPWTVNELTDEE